MKKTLQTVITAAMFAAASSAYDCNSFAGEIQDTSPEMTAETVTTDYDPATEEQEDVYGPPPAWNTPIESVQTTATNEIPAPVYGPPLAWTTTSEIDLPVPTTMPTTEEPVCVYGPPIAWETTTAEPELTTQTTIIPLPVYGPPAAWIGDLNEDDRVDVFDMIELKNMYLNGITKDSMDLYRADINQDGKIDMADLVMLQNYLLGRTKKIYDHQFEEPKPTEPQKSYVNTTNTTATTTEPIPECVYGPPIAFD
ncbi:MAG: dockerin type I repeat-containing protein [Ruminococcus sp.]|nr:dockerin type I repeat-containing protein [Ruminococcus sp.]MDE6788392.1 dockerin type I repeat-containing protein [Ruminococcus sp.]